eukprot:7493531-Pyramimonas_sp.AAC.1
MSVDWMLYIYFQARFHSSRPRSLNLVKEGWLRGILPAAVFPTWCCQCAPHWPARHAFGSLRGR